MKGSRETGGGERARGLLWVDALEGGERSSLLLSFPLRPNLSAPPPTILIKGTAAPPPPPDAGEAEPTILSTEPLPIRM